MKTLAHLLFWSAWLTICVDWWFPGLQYLTIKLGLVAWITCLLTGTIFFLCLRKRVDQ